jgi:hypothetical protein
MPPSHPDYRRHYPRVATGWRARLDGAAETQLLEVEDLSVRGLRLLGALSLPVGARVSLIVDATVSQEAGPTTSRLALRGRVVRLEERPELRWAMAVEIEPVAEITRELIALIAAHAAKVPGPIPDGGAPEAAD